MKIENLEIFRAGDYGALGKWSEDDLERLAAVYDPQFHEAPINVDHEERGPAFGWVKRLTRRGATLLADVEFTSREFFEKVRSGEWKKRSAEIYRNLDGRGPYLRAVSFLGTVPPIVKGLADPVFAEMDRKAEKVFIDFAETANREIGDPGKNKNGREGSGDSTDGGDGTMSKTLKEVLAGKKPEEVAAFFAEGLDDSLLSVKAFGEFVTAKATAAATAAVTAAFEKAGLDETGKPKAAKAVEMDPATSAMFAEEQKKRQASEARVLELEKRDFERDLAVTFGERMRQGRLTPAIAKPLKALASVLRFSSIGEQTVTFSEKDKDGKVVNVTAKAADLVDQVLAAMPVIVRMGEMPQPDLPETTPGVVTREDGTTIERADLDAEVKAFMETSAKAGKVITYAEGYAHVTAKRAEKR